MALRRNLPAALTLESRLPMREIRTELAREALGRLGREVRGRAQANAA